jgi:multiple sugar transport system permease protein
MYLHSRVSAIILILPLVLVLASLTIYPFLNMVYMSFHNYDLAKGGDPKFIGLGNYLAIFKDRLAISSVEFTAILVVIALPLEMLFGMGIAWLFRNLIVGERFMRSLVLLPMMVPAVVAGIAWKMLFNYNFGPLNYFLSLFGISNISWLGDPNFARLGIIIVDLWQWTPFVFLVLYSGLQSMPAELVEAARVDGASSWAVIRYVELPILAPLIGTVLIIRLIDLLKLFDIIYMITWGGPGSATHSFSYYIYKVGLSYGWDVGYASALSIVLLIVVVFLVNLLMRVLRLRALLEL